MTDQCRKPAGMAFQVAVPYDVAVIFFQDRLYCLNIAFIVCTLKKVLQESLTVVVVME